MPPLDSATINAVLQKQGMPNTTENLNRIAQFAAMHPDLLAKYLGQGTDAAALAGAGTNGAIDNSIAAVEGRGQLAGPNPYSSTLDPNTGLSNIGPGLVNTPEPTSNGAPRGRVSVGQPQRTGASGTSAVVDPGLANPAIAGGAPANGQPPVNPLTPDSGNVVNTPSMWEALALSLGPAGKLLVDRARLQALQNQRGPYAPPPGMTPNQVGPQQPQGPWQQPQAAGRGAGAGGTAQPNTSRAGSVPPSAGGTTATPSSAPRAGGSVPPSGAGPNVSSGPHMPQPAPSGPAHMPGGAPQSGPTAPGPQPYTEGPRGPHMPTPPTDRPSYMPPLDQYGQSPEEIARMKAEVAAENAQAEWLQSQMKDRARTATPNTATPKKPRVPGRP